MVLAFDIGNSNIVLGGYQEESLSFLSRITTNRRLEADQYAVELGGIFNLYNVACASIEGIVISSVVPDVTDILLEALAHYTSQKAHLLSLKDAGGIQIDIENPGELGMDILASALAVRQSHPLPAVIIDMGTATKLTALDAGGCLRGVSIAPGLHVSLQALVGNTSLLRGIALTAPPAAIGRNTVQSMQSGAILGNAAMLDGLIDRFEQEMGEIQTLVATGGTAPFIVPHCRRNILYRSSLLLDGLYLAYKAIITKH